MKTVCVTSVLNNEGGGILKKFSNKRIKKKVSLSL